ncbi:MAG: hypothetical protein GWN84_07650 [Gammaproteobacteria bacterium]|nr:hypothetical protein [Gammaproteobacteria bacterium]NIR82757.1 hypothetical protein [Gammaproteobacteria bacterium]NIR89621.1 hypothetical protein [Gammaproteobacteria bacterium]
METIDSKHPFTEAYAKEYSIDGINWQPIPEGVTVRASRFALILDEISPGDLDIDLATYTVPIGPSEGKNAADYVAGRVDKACLQKSEAGIVHKESRIIKAGYTARLKEPFAALLR